MNTDNCSSSTIYNPRDSVLWDTRPTCSHASLTAGCSPSSCCARLEAPPFKEFLLHCFVKITKWWTIEGRSSILPPLASPPSIPPQMLSHHSLGCFSFLPSSSAATPPWIGDRPVPGTFVLMLLGFSCVCLLEDQYSTVVSSTLRLVSSPLSAFEICTCVPDVVSSRSFFSAASSTRLTHLCLDHGTHTYTALFSCPPRPLPASNEKADVTLFENVFCIVNLGFC